MASLTSAERNDINYYDPMMQLYVFGDRLRYLTTAGAFSSGTLAGNDLSSGTSSGMALTNPSVVFFQFTAGAIQSSANSTSTGVTKVTAGGHYTLSATGGSVCRISTALTSGTFVTITNIATAATGQISLATDISMWVGGATNYALMTLSAGKTVTFMKYNATGRYLLVSATGVLAALTSDSTSS